MTAMGRSDRRELVCIGACALPGELVVPPGAQALVLFADGGGTARDAGLGRRVAEVLQRRRLATLLFSLLQPSELADPRRLDDVDLLGQRLADALDWAERRDDEPGLQLGLIGTGIAAAAALMAAARRPARVCAVVSFSGRPDLAAQRLPDVLAPTLLIVGAADARLLALNRQALHALPCRRRLEVVPGAGPAFEAPGALDSAAALAAFWFDNSLESHP